MKSLNGHRRAPATTRFFEDLKARLETLSSEQREELIKAGADALRKSGARGARKAPRARRRAQAPR